MFDFRRLFFAIGSVLLLACATLTTAYAVTPNKIPQRHPGIILEQLASGLGVVWGMTFVAKNQLLFTERNGRLGLLALDSLQVRYLSGLPNISSAGQGGLLDVATGPNYRSDGWIYLTYSKATTDGPVTTLARGKLGIDAIEEWQDLLVTDSATDTGQHFGSRIAFDRQGHVYFGIGDRGVRKQAQDRSNHQGSILRLKLDGSLPDDNPFIGDSSIRPEIWSYGHRNPQGLTFDIATNRLWSIEHGPRGGDEINLIKKAANYGWPVVSHGKEYWGPLSIGEGVSKPGLEDPVKVYIPSIAPGSLLLYRGDAFPEWRGNLFAGALKLRHLNRVSLSQSGAAIDEERLFGELGQRIRALLESPEGWIIMSTDNGDILRLRPDS